MNNRILIVGASIAGLTAAHWLVRAGYTVTVAERAPSLRRGGNGVDIRGTAADVICDMGLTEAVQARASDVIGMRFVDSADRERARIDTRLPGAVEIMRGDLCDLLLSAVPGVSIFASATTSGRSTRTPPESP